MDKKAEQAERRNAKRSRRFKQNKKGRIFIDINTNSIKPNFGNQRVDKNDASR